eukprot:CAMPEP_0168743550 /NCGR_PEP_ID=MMETSP0724-20121128/13635_1 /TAXON_ID=265536 /ORGANISM="Amphiprora sp., Strain CCMP467" /LENGTH=212 /DNA_ID=CAMNT_0008791185 /DNA_START=88 /DNA_END=726 /DNA_ORIENTATION=-
MAYLMRRGAIPFFVGGASISTALYAVKMEHAAASWQAWASSLRTTTERNEPQFQDEEAQIHRRPDNTMNSLDGNKAIRTNYATADNHIAATSPTTATLMATRRLTQRLQSQSYQHQAQMLHQHAASSAALALTGTVATYQAWRDWAFYRKGTTPPGIEARMVRATIRRGLFLLRPSVLAAALVSFGSVQYYFGTIRVLYFPQEELFLFENQS